MTAVSPKRCCGARRAARRESARRALTARRGKSLRNWSSPSSGWPVPGPRGWRLDTLYEICHAAREFSAAAWTALCENQDQRAGRCGAYVKSILKGAAMFAARLPHLWLSIAHLIEMTGPLGSWRPQRPVESRGSTVRRASDLAPFFAQGPSTTSGRASWRYLTHHPRGAGRRNYAGWRAAASAIVPYSPLAVELEEEKREISGGPRDSYVLHRVL